MRPVGYVVIKMKDNNLVIGKDLKVWFSTRRTIFSKPIYVKAVDGVTISIKKGETAAVVGESGCGKTTLGKTLLKLYKPTSGQIIYNGKRIDILEEKDLKWYRREAQIIYQDPYSSLNPFFTIERILMEPLIINKIGNSVQERREIVYHALQDVKLEPPELFANKYPHMLSGGQRQRVAIARSLITNPRFIVADEPVSMLDASVRVEIMYLLKNIQEKYNTSFLYITHDVSTVKYFSDTINIMYAGKIVESGPVREVLANPLHPYTQALIEAIPDPDPANRKTKRSVPAGEPPSLINPPSGCRFHPRCPYFIKGKCEVIEPVLIEKISNHKVACHLY
jgi:peptide/nickel transport system ATP-binding protein